MMPDLSLTILDLAENCIRAEADFVKIQLDENIKSDILTLIIEDNGKGMTSMFVKQITNPFTTTRTTRKVGLGIPFAKQIADMCEGDLAVNSQIGKGTEIILKLKHSHIDRPPLGDIGSLFHSLIVLNPEINFLFNYSTEKGSFSLDIREWKKILEDIPVNTSEISKALKNEIKKGLNKIGR
ncbi:MAG: ATP-binding protein [Candidatus Muiribacteriota bacterium]